MIFSCNKCAHKEMHKEDKFNIPFCSFYGEQLKTTLVGMLSNPATLSPCERCTTECYKHFMEVKNESIFNN